MSPIEEQLHAALDSLETRDDFVRFVNLLVTSCHEPGPPWENATLATFLIAFSQAAESLEHFYESPDEAARNIVAPSWEAIAGLLFTARCGRDPEHG